MQLPFEGVGQSPANEPARDRLFETGEISDLQPIFPRWPPPGASAVTPAV